MTTYSALYDVIYAMDQNADEMRALQHRILYGTFGAWEWVGFDDALTQEHALDELEARMHLHELYLIDLRDTEDDLGLS